MANTPVKCACLPENEGVGGNRVESRFLLFFDGILESTDVLSIRNFDREDVTWIIAVHDTVEIKVRGAGFGRRSATGN